jgi:hypothetical protein
MDFMKLLKSLEELLYEVASWLLFYPITLWRSVVHPSVMMRYADTELSDDDAEQYIDTLNPPIFLMITLVIAHGLELKLTDDESWMLMPFLAQDSNLLLFRAIMFSIFPLLMALKLLRFRKLPLDRRTLKAPFYAQCYVVAPFALALSIGFILLRMTDPSIHAAGVVVVCVSLIWYAVIETRWFMTDAGISAFRAAASVVATLFEAFLALTVAALFIALK